jgi:predicted HNH restriction endonuclease
MYKERITYRSEIIAALRQLGGKGSLFDIYKIIEERSLLDNIYTNKNWRNNVCKEIQKHSSDTKSYKNKEDLFTSVGGIGKGIWAIRGLNVPPQKLQPYNISEIFDELDVDKSFAEGSRKKVLVNSYERNPDLRKTSIALYGTICKICDFNFAEHYGPRGIGFIELHHIVPLSELGHEHIANAEDLLPVCSNCHSMIHRSKPFLTIAEMQDLYFLYNTQ